MLFKLTNDVEVTHVSRTRWYRTRRVAHKIGLFSESV